MVEQTARLFANTTSMGRSVRARLAALWQAAQPTARERRAAAFGGAAVLLLLAAVTGRLLHTGLGTAADMLVMAVLASLVLLVAAGALWLIARALVWAPRFLGWLGTAAAVLVALMFAPSGVPQLAGAAFGVALFAALFTASIAGLSRATRARRITLAITAVASLAILATTVAWLRSPGSGEPSRGASVAAVRKGPYAVRTLTYGSGNDERRAEFGKGVALRTVSVDARPFVKDFKGMPETLRRRYWGFGAESYPLNGRVWYPEGKGPFPLVLAVHGNHIMGEYSDTGYAWLGELLASRGMIVVSVDQNFLNLSIAGGVPKENDARAWLLLEHLRVWRAWNGAAGNPFHGRVDLDSIALVGHSRGGEAAAIAGAFNRLARYPDDARVAFDYDFSIRAIVAIAPSDGQYNPGDRPVVLENVNYLTMQGGHDGDVTQFMGDRQYHRVRFTGEGDWFKAGVYIPGANHGQFNTVWGRNDAPAPFSWFLNTRPVMDAEEQRRIAAVCISGFLEAALRGDDSYRALFRDPRTGGAYLTRYEDSSFRLLADYEEDVDVTTTSARGGAVRAEGFSIWREQDAQLRNKTPRRNHAVYLGWLPGAKSAYAITIPDAFARGDASRLVLDIAEVDENPDPDAKKKGSDRTRKHPLDLTVELRDRAGKIARLPLSRFGSILPRQQLRLTKWSVMDDAAYGRTAEPVFDTIELPLAAFAAAAPGFAPAELQSVRLAFDRGDSGVVALDRVGFTR